jgi:S-adenosylmethionine:tRNA ribosyltransferase-isomerase
MRTELLDNPLPPELIAQQPAENRADARLLILNRTDGSLADSCFARIGEFLRPGDCLVLNDTKVIPAKFYLRRSAAAKTEGLFLAEKSSGLWHVLLKNSRRIKAGQALWLCDRAGDNFCTAEAVNRLRDGSWLLKINPDSYHGCAEAVLEKIGFAPLPPYIKRADDTTVNRTDRVRYQTVYARCPGAIAAPTAGLHFSKQLIKQLKKDGVHFAYLTLHVGPGTFRPITTKNLQAHRMEAEWFRLDGQNAAIINTARQKKGRIIAVGTTSVRTLETVVQNNTVKAASGRTRLFIRPGYTFKIVDALVTNFHLPKTTLLSLVAAFAGLQNVLNAYRHAVEKKYRFYSYGDAMLII